MDAEAFSLQPYLTYEELMGEKLPANELIAHISTIDFDFAIRSVAMLASIVANYGGPRSSEARKHSFFELAGYKTVNPQLGAVVDRLRVLPPGRVIAHEEGLAYLTALIISFAIEGGRKCSPAEITFLALATNDYLVGAHPPEDGLTELESLMADVVRIGRFNWNHDSAAEFARGCALMRQHPKRGSWKTHEDWISLQRNAFGMTLDEYLENYLGPLLLFSKTWGRLNKDQKLLAPVVNIKTWLSQANADQKFATQFVESLCASRESSREKLLSNVQANGLPRSFGPLYERPLLRSFRGCRHRSVTLDPEGTASGRHLGTSPFCSS